MNEILIVIVILGAISYSFWSYVQLALMKFIKGDWRVKLNSILSILALVVLFVPTMINSDIMIAVYAYAFGIIGINAFYLYKGMKETGLYFPKGTISVCVSFILVLMTPVADLVLGRTYGDRGAVLFACASLAGTLLHIWYVFLTHKDLRANLDGLADNTAESL